MNASEGEMNFALEGGDESPHSKSREGGTAVLDAPPNKKTRSVRSAAFGQGFPGDWEANGSV